MKLLEKQKPLLYYTTNVWENLFLHGVLEVPMIIGTSVERLDARDKARGVALYSGDYYKEGMLYCVLVRSKIPHGLLKALHIPACPEGVVCYTASDLVSNVIPSVCNDQPVFASDHIRYQGEPVAVVAAPSLEQARAFASTITMDIEELPVLDNYEEALSDSAPRLYEQGNLCRSFHSEKGNLEESFRESAFVFEETFHMPMQCHGFMEPEAAFTYVDEKGRLSLVSSTQNAWADKNTICSVLGLPLEQVDSRAGVVGGGFGGKDGNTAQIYPAIVTRFTGKPAKLVFTREENIRYGMKRHPATVKAKAGFDNEGHILAFEGYMCLDTGAYAILGPAVLGLGLEHMTGPYFIPSVRLDGHLVYTNHAPASAMRGFGAPQSAIAIETFLNRAAEKLGLDPLEIRKRNAIHRWQSGSMGGRMLHCTEFAKALDQFGNSAFYQEMQGNKDPEIGYGIAAGMMSSGMGKGVPDDCYATVEQKPDGTYLVTTSLVDIGQGSQTTLAMIAAETLGVPMSAIDMRMGFTDGQGNSGSTAASRSTFVAGNAIRKAALQVKGHGGKAEAKYAFPETTEEGIHAFFSYMVQGVKLKVDRTTGEVKVLRVHNVTETGKVINPTLMEGQAFGGIVMSLGYALSEEVRYRNGISLENGMANYIMPTSTDAPHLTNENVDAYEEEGPFGAKGVAECSTVALAPAIIAAVHALCPDVTITKLPIDRLALIRRR